MLENNQGIWRIPGNANMKFNHVNLAEDIWDSFSLVWYKGELYYYSNGVYRSGAKSIIEGEAQRRLGLESTNARKAEVYNWLETNAKVNSVEVEDNTNIINFQNGLYDIKESKLLPHNPSHFSTVQIPINYNEDAECPKVNEFLASVVPNDSVDFVFEWFGFSLLREYKFSKALMLYGTGGNGKSVFIQLYNAFLGSENVSGVDLHYLETNRFGASRLFNKLANTFADIQSSYIESSKLLKSLTGNDKISAEFKGKDLFEFKNYAKLSFSANKLPQFKDNSQGYYDRWLILPFPNRFRETEKQNINLSEELITPQELSGLLNYALRGLKDILDNGKFTVSSSMEAELNKWKNNSDSVIMFVQDEDTCELSTEFEVEKMVLFNKYKQWCSSSDHKTMSRNNFYERMEYHGFPSSQKNNTKDKRKRVFKGIKLLDS